MSRGGRPWRRLRHRVFVRDGWACTQCGRSPKTTRGLRLECHHVVPVFRGGPSKVDNLSTLCYDCHRAKTAEQREARRRRRTPWERFRDGLMPGEAPANNGGGPGADGRRGRGRVKVPAVVVKPADGGDAVEICFSVDMGGGKRRHLAFRADFVEVSAVEGVEVVQDFGEGRER